MADKLYAEAQRLAHRGNCRAYAQVLADLARGESDLLIGAYARAEVALQRGYAAARASQWNRGLAVAPKGLAILHWALGNYSQTEENSVIAEDAARRFEFDRFVLECLLLQGMALRHQRKIDEAHVRFAECRRWAEQLGGGVLMGPILWEEGCLAEQEGDYLTATERCRSALSIGLPNWWSFALPTLGWALIGLGEPAEADTYFRTVLSTAGERTPVKLDATAGLTYLAALQIATARPEADSVIDKPMTREDVVRSWQDINRHPAATNETRLRIAQLAATLGLSLDAPTASNPQV
ncbi:MAG: hypothetical protein R2854_11265 [Caldilineaceae bacterium]